MANQGTAEDYESLFYGPELKWSVREMCGGLESSAEAAGPWQVRHHGSQVVGNGIEVMLAMVAATGSSSFMGQVTSGS
jgi:hypothetical protein